MIRLYRLFFTLVVIFAGTTIGIDAAAAASSGTSSIAARHLVDRFAFSDVIALIGGPANAKMIGRITNSTHVSFVELHMLRGYPSTGFVLSASSRRALAKLAAEIGHNHALDRKMRRAGYLANEVVALAKGGRGNVVVFVNL